MARKCIIHLYTSDRLHDVGKVFIRLYTAALVAVFIFYHIFTRRSCTICMYYLVVICIKLPGVRIMINK